MRRTFERLMEDLWQALKDPSQDYSVLCNAVHGVRVFLPELEREPLKVREVIAFVQELRASDIPYRLVNEEQLMEILISLARYATKWLQDEMSQKVSTFDQIDAASVEFQARMEVLRDLHIFAIACFAFKRQHNNFGGKRRGYAYDILTLLSDMADMPEVVALARKSLKKANSIESRKAINFLKKYFFERELPEDGSITNELLSLVERTDSQTTAYYALDLLVENGEIDDSEAISLIDDWKSKHR